MSEYEYLHSCLHPLVSLCVRVSDTGPLPRCSCLEPEERSERERERDREREEGREGGREIVEEGRRDCW